MPLCLACFGLAFITGLLQLSTALGAFLGGMLIATAKETEWVQHNLEPFRTLFVAFFFVSVGLMVDLSFIATYWLQITLLVLAVLVSNTFINAVVLRSLSIPLAQKPAYGCNSGPDWRVQLYFGGGRSTGRNHH